jgi:hypothetical protein
MLKDWAEVFEAIEMGMHEAQIANYEDEIARLNYLLREAHKSLGFAASVIKSGEPWSPECEVIIGQALRATPPTE